MPVKCLFYGLAFSVLMFTVPSRTFAQFRVQGYVYDADTKAPLPGANVFLANSTKGTSTGLDGSFTIANLQAMRFKLVVSFIGYKTQVFEVLPGEPLLFKVMLETAPEVLDEVVIRARKSSGSEWLANLALFKQYFIGLSENSSACTFENPQVIKLDNYNGILTAISDSPVVIENKGLGYRLRFLVQEYKLNIQLKHIRYQGQVAFELMIPSSDEEKISWAKNRLKAYYGSEMHFLRALYNRNLFDEGFYFDLLHEPGGHRSASTSAYDKVLVRSDLHKNKSIKIETLTNYNLILDSIRSTPAEPILKFNGELLVQYIHESEEYDYQAHHYGAANYTRKRLQHSRAVMIAPEGIVQPLGQLWPEYTIQTAGYWGWDLVAESLPLDYDPEVDKKILGITGRPTDVSSR